MLQPPTTNFDTLWMWHCDDGDDDVIGYSDGNIRSENDVDDPDTHVFGH